MCSYFSDWPMLALIPTVLLVSRMTRPSVSPALPHIASKMELVSLIVTLIILDTPSS